MSNLVGLYSQPFAIRRFHVQSRPYRPVEISPVTAPEAVTDVATGDETTAADCADDCLGGEEDQAPGLILTDEEDEPSAVEEAGDSYAERRSGEAG